MKFTWSNYSLELLIDENTCNWSLCVSDALELSVLSLPNLLMGAVPLTLFIAVTLPLLGVVPFPVGRSTLSCWA